MKRRAVFHALGTLLLGQQVSQASETTPSPQATETYGCLVDTTLCVGCRECEKACNQSNELPPLATAFNDTRVFEESRRPDAEHFTVVNRYAGAPSPSQTEKDETFVKVQCMHCEDPACVSACIVGALQKRPEGAVIYDADVCIGCRYCMVACPFQIPAYEYADALAPRVRKCSFCFEQQTERHTPACAAACPREAIVFGKRSDLLTLAHQKIEANPARYTDSVYGEHEVGGTSWLYLTGRPAEEIGLLPLDHNAPPCLTETIQHGLFKWGLPPLAVYGTLGGLMWFNTRKKQVQQDESNPASEEKE